MTITEKLRKKWRRTGTLMRGALIGSTILAGTLLAGEIASTDESPTWHYIARESATDMSFTDFMSKAGKASREAELVIYIDKAILRPSGENPEIIRTDLNSIITETLSNQVSKIPPRVIYARFPETDPGPLDTLFLFLPEIIFLSLIGFIAWPMVMGRLGGYKLIRPEDLTTRLDDVAGIAHAHKEVSEIISLMRDGASNIGKAQFLGARLPKGVAFAGPPGTGKTLLARAIAAEAGLSFLEINTSALHEKFVGIGVMRLRAAFDKARKSGPCIIFMDEAEALGSRSSSGSDRATENNSLINCLLTLMDGLQGNSGIFVIMASNRLENLDPALRRSGRIDMVLNFSLPNRAARLDILRLHSRNLPLDSVDLDALAGSTAGMNGADLATLCNDAALRAFDAKKSTVDTEDFRQARKRRIFSQNSGEIILTKEERESVAAHEAGHAIAALVLPECDPVEHISILPRGGALGYVLQQQESDRHLESMTRLTSRMTLLAAGRMAEEVCFGPNRISTGAENDIAEMTRIATDMVTRFGMSPLGMARISPDATGQIPGDARVEILTLINAAREEARRVIDTYRSEHAQLVDMLLARDEIHPEDKDFDQLRRSLRNSRGPRVKMA